MKPKLSDAELRKAFRSIAKELARRGGLASARALTPEERRARARKAGKRGGRGRPAKQGGVR